MKSSPTSRQIIWSTAGGGPARTGRSATAGRVAAPPALSISVGAGVQAAVVFDADHRAFVADMAGSVYAFESGARQVWRQTLDGAISATPVADLGQGRVFVGTQAGWLYSLKTKDGAVLWRRRLPTTSDPRIVADLLFLPDPARVVASSWGGQFHAINPDTGESISTWDAGISPQAAASADSKGNFYFLRAVRGEGISLVCVTPDGVEKTLHRRPEGERRAERAVVVAAPVIDDERELLYFVANGDRTGGVHAWDLAAAKLAWSVELERALVATPALRADGVLMLADMTGMLSAVDSGRIRFRYSTGCDYLLVGPVCNNASLVYLGDPVGALHEIGPEGEGKRLFEARRSLQARPSWNSSGDLFLPSMDGHVYVFRPAGDL